MQATARLTPTKIQVILVEYSPSMQIFSDVYLSSLLVHPNYELGQDLDVYHDVGQSSQESCLDWTILVGDGKLLIDQGVFARGLSLSANHGTSVDILHNQMTRRLTMRRCPSACHYTLKPTDCTNKPRNESNDGYGYWSRHNNDCHHSPRNLYPVSTGLRPVQHLLVTSFKPCAWAKACCHVSTVRVLV